MKLEQFSLRLGAHEYKPLVIGAMGVDISTVELALEAARLGAVGHISDAMVSLVSDRRFGTNFSATKSERFKESLNSPQKQNVKFDLQDLRQAQLNQVEDAMRRKTGEGAIFINIMEKLTMGAPQETLAVRLRAALDGGIDGITLSAGLHTGSLGLISEHPRFHDAKIGIIVSSDRALKIFLKSARRYSRFPDYIIVEGPLAGGHLGFGEDWKKHNLHVIVRSVLDLLREEQLDIPVIPAGGIFTGTDATEFIQEGASAVQVATRFTVSKEAGLPPAVKQKYFEAKESDVVVNSFSPTGYLMRMLTSSPCLNSNIRPACEGFGYMLSRDGACQYLGAYEETPVGPDGKKLTVKTKMCLCYHFSKFNCYTCGHNVFRLRDTTLQNPDGSFVLPTAEHIILDYLQSEDHSIRLPTSAQVH